MSTSTSTPEKHTGAGAARGHTAATLYEAAVAANGPGRYAMDVGIRAAWPGARVAAPAYTVQGAGGDNLALQHAILAAPAGSVLVADVNGADYGHWGEVLAVASQVRRLAGLVIDGGVPYTVEMAELGFPAFSRHVNVRGTRKLFRGALDVPVQVGGLTVRTGDLVVGDTDGVVVLPQQMTGRVLDTADERVAEEADIMHRLKAGESSLDICGLTEAGRG
jgi:4-hydroxy-4-methyl-2-oxoglutarate aldolase